MHGLYLSRECSDLEELSRELMGLHCWFHRNVAFSALIRGAEIAGWKQALTKTWLYRGTLHGVAEDDLPQLLALHVNNSYLAQWWGADRLDDLADEVLRLMEDGVFSRAEMREIFADRLSEEDIRMVFSPWGGIFVYLARLGKVAFRDMTSRDFDLIDAAPTRSREEVLPELLRRYFAAYGPATLADAAWFLGFWGPEKKLLKDMDLSEFSRFDCGSSTYYYVDDGADLGEIPELTLLSGFDPVIVSYVDRSAVLSPEYRSRAVMKSGICLPTVAVNGRVAGLWNIKNGAPIVEFFDTQEPRIVRETKERVDFIRFRTAGRI